MSNHGDGEYMEEDNIDEDNDDEQIADSEQGAINRKNRKVYVPGMSRSLKNSEELVYDPKAYLLLHTFETNYSCLSFDILPDTLGNNRQSYPMTAWLTAGTQADKAKNNELLVMRLSNMHANKKTLKAKEEGRNNRQRKQENTESSSSSSSSSSEESSDDEEEADKRGGAPKKREPRLHAALIPHYGGINRIKCQQLGQSSVCAVWNDQKKVQIWNLNRCMDVVNQMDANSASKWQKLEHEKPLYSYAGHSAEGFALAWNPLQTGMLASGDHHHRIFLWRMSEGGQWLINQQPLSDHQESVEDLAWSTTEDSLLMSCSCDRSIRLWDIRSPAKQACVCVVRDAHEADVNVLSWNPEEPLILSGGDDGALRVWSLRTIQYNQPVALFRHHRKPITSVEWSPNDSTVFMASGEDDQTTIWDLALEEEEPTGRAEQMDEGQQSARAVAPIEQQISPQLLFIHMGQKEVKEVHWHKQCPGLAMTTSLDGFHVFKTINV